MTAARVALFSHRGAVRAVNEDSAAVSGLVLVGDLERPVELTVPAPDPCMVAIADGMGGHVGGRRASRLALWSLLADPSATDGEEGIRGAVARAAATVERDGAAQPEHERAGTTLVALVIQRDWTRALVANVGDSAAFVLLGDRLVQASVDDVPAASGAGGAITQCLGAGCPAPDCHIREVDLSVHRRLLLCSDGLTDAVDRADLAAILGGGAPVHDVAARLLSAALTAGARDNVSAAVVDLPAADAEARR